MVLGWERINSKTSTPNKNIVFIKPLPGPQESISKDYLERIAAQCLPIMKKHHLAVVSLEEYEPNREFWGRNFNNGEIVQLVLRSPTTGHWLPFKFVQMVMMHELAHNKQMNHSKAFWAVRNEFSSEMKALWARGYTGDGLWGRGVLLENGLFDRETLEEGEVLPEHMCGGTFKSRASKRTVKPKITYKEQKERRIKKKFGLNGIALGADNEIKAQLEKGKRTVSKPRVAGSARGRELRAAAALARFEVKKDGPEIKDEDLVTDSEAGSDVEEDFVIKTKPDDAVDINGQPLLDTKGHRLVRVCGDEEKDDEDAKNELQELQNLPSQSPQHSSTKRTSTNKSSQTALATISRPLQASESSKQGIQPQSLAKSQEPLAERGAQVSTTVKDETTRLAALQYSKPDDTCPICSVVNGNTALTCVVCSNVLKPKFVPGFWRCKSSACEASQYVNAGDVGLCGVCGARKQLN
ncbi:WLM-domain-containing protein [Stipitochalara longipes BDJ]|nr:WLM-domain-containing protein [Stipitochalara longipes BDJ]